MKLFEALTADVASCTPPGRLFLATWSRRSFVKLAFSGQFLYAGVSTSYWLMEEGIAHSVDWYSVLMLCGCSSFS